MLPLPCHARSVQRKIQTDYTAAPAAHDAEKQAASAAHVEQRPIFTGGLHGPLNEVHMIA
jgi:hypothetical protein